MTTCEFCNLEMKGGSAEERETTVCAACNEFNQQSPQLHISPLERDDLELVLAWRSNPEIYQYFREQDAPLYWNQHVSWYESRDDDRHDFIIHFNGRRVGGVNIDSEDFVGIYLGDVSARGKGVATAVLRWLCDRFDHRAPLIAEIHKENDPSKQLFERCGFRQNPDEDSDDDEWLRYIYEP